jgi:methanogenic corrinoid protein MtbC1
MDPAEDGQRRPTGALSRRPDASDHVLRAQESEQRVRQMQAHLSASRAAAEAARSTLRDGAGAPGRPAGRLLSAAALDAFDEEAAQAVLDRLLTELPLPAALRDVLLPYLADLGDRWQRGTASIIQEHFATNIIRGRLAGLARGWGGGQGRRALLACAPGDQHDLALMMFGIVLHRSGWGIHYFGTTTPPQELERAVDATHPDLVVLAATIPGTLEPLRPELASLARHAPLALAGAGVTAQLANLVGARFMTGDPVTAAEQADRSP